MSKHSRPENSSCPSPRRRSVVAIFGGDGRWSPGESTDDVTVRICPSSKHGGNARWRSLAVAIRAGFVDRVFVLARWLGHSESHAIVDACRRAGVPVQVVAGGATAAARALSAYLGRAVRRGA